MICLDYAKHFKTKILTTKYAFLYHCGYRNKDYLRNEIKKLRLEKNKIKIKNNLQSTILIIKKIIIKIKRR